jgi:hypothetical protein
MEVILPKNGSTIISEPPVFHIGGSVGVDHRLSDTALHLYFFA